MEFQPRVESVQDLRRSVRTFQKGTLDDQRDAFGSNPVYFLHLRTPKGHRFAPSKFGAYVGLSVADYHQKRVKKHYTGGENQKWIAGVMGQPWTLLSSASKSTQAAFSEWFTSTTGRALPDRNLYLMELDSSDSSGKETAASKGSNPGGGTKGTVRRARDMTPEQLAKRLLAQAATGRAGEEIAKRSEIERLRQLGVKKPETYVQHTAEISVSRGYDIESNGPDGQRLIEVKSSTDHFSDGFFLSRKEWKKLKQAGDSAYLYLVSVTDVQRLIGKVIRKIRNPIQHLQTHARRETALFQVWLGKEKA